MASVAIATGAALACDSSATVAEDKTASASQATVTVDGETYRFSADCWINGDPPQSLTAKGPGEDPGGKPVHLSLLASVRGFGQYEIHARDTPADINVENRMVGGGLPPDKIELTPAALRASVTATTFAGKKRLKRSVPAELEITGCRKG